MAWPRCFQYITFESFLLTHSRYDDFLLPMWTDSALLYAVWSSLCSLYGLCVIFYSGTGTGYGVKILIWLTYWSFFCLTARFICTAVNCWYYIFNQRSTKNSRTGEDDVFSISDGDQSINNNGSYSPMHVVEIKTARGYRELGVNDELPVGISSQWFLQNVTNATSILVTAMFWGIVYSGNPQTYMSINSHVLNSLLVLSDIMLNRAPIRIQHAHMPVIFLSIYITFTLIYWGAGGTNHKGHMYIYRVLDYSERPGTAAIAICVVALIAVPLIQVFLYGLHRLKTTLHARWKTTRVYLQNHNNKSLPDSKQETNNTFTYKKENGEQFACELNSGDSLS